MSRSIAILGAGPGLGQAVARRYAEEGYEVVLVARRSEPLEKLAAELAATGATTHVVPADLSDTDGMPRLAAQIEAKVDGLGALYYGPTTGGARAATKLTPEDVQTWMPVTLYSLIALVREFLPQMVARQEGAILLATGASALQGMPNFSGPSQALAAQRNYLQSLQAELVGKGIYIGRLYVGTPIKGSAWHARIEAEKAAGRSSAAQRPAVDPVELADLLWTMHTTSKHPEAVYPKGLFNSPE